MCTCVYASAINKPVEDSKEVNLEIDFRYIVEVDAKELEGANVFSDIPRG